jgi:hypothetical protein
LRFDPRCVPGKLGAPVSWGATSQGGVAPRRAAPPSIALEHATSGGRLSRRSGWPLQPSQLDAALGRARFFGEFLPALLERANRTPSLWRAPTSKAQCAIMANVADPGPMPLVACSRAMEGGAALRGATPPWLVAPQLTGAPSLPGTHRGSNLKGPSERL